MCSELSKYGGLLEGNLVAAQNITANATGEFKITATNTPVFISISGFVWEEVLQGKNTQERNYLFDNGDNLIQGIQVKLINQVTGEERVTETDENAGSRDIPFTKELYIERSDFEEVPPPKFFRLKPEGEVRLMGAYIIKCGEIIKNPDGSIKEIHCTADLKTGNGTPTDRKVKGTIHWVSAKYCKDVDLVLYDKLFTHANMNEIPTEEYNEHLNKESIKKLTGCKAELALADAALGEPFQFVRMGYFTKDYKYPDTFIRTVTLKDGFIKK